MTDESQNNTSFQDEWRSVLVVDGVEYTVTVNSEQRKRAATLIRPKPVKTDANALEVERDHRDSVMNVALFLINAMMELIEHHDENKTNQTPDEHHLEPHHATFEPKAKPHNGYPVWYLAEVTCDYLSTVYGRAEAGRGFDIMLPETQLDGWGSMLSTCLSMIHWMGLGTVTPEPAPLPGAQSEWREVA